MMKSMGDRAKERVAEVKKKAMEMMKGAGFEFDADIQVSVDPKLPFMGYSRPQGNHYQIVVSGGALESGMLEALLLHEMSHIYRMQTGHPSHNSEVIGEVMDSLRKEALSHDYQRKIIYDLTNNIEDLYADDIAVRIIKGSGILSPGQISRFLQDWVKEEPAKEKDATKERWLNGWILANNARAIAQMARHEVEDIDGRAAAANKRFLSRVDHSMASRFGYFLNLLRNLREDITDDEYRRLLTEYLDNFLKMVGTEPN